MARKNIKRPRLNSRRKRRVRHEQELQEQEEKLAELQKTFAVLQAIQPLGAKEDSPGYDPFYMG